MTLFAVPTSIDIIRCTLGGARPLLHGLTGELRIAQTARYSLSVLTIIIHYISSDEPFP